MMYWITVLEGQVGIVAPQMFVTARGAFVGARGITEFSVRIIIALKAGMVRLAGRI
jgi:hypothetical protein